MRITDPDTRSALAGEYVLGTLHGRARARFELWLRSDPGLRREVARWEERLMPLTGQVPAIAPSPAVWESIHARINRRRMAQPTPGGWWQRLGFWRSASVASTLAAAVLLTYVAATPREHALLPAQTMVSVMTDDKANPALTVAWSPEAPRGGLRVRVIGHAEMAPGTAWELWMLPGGDQPPKSLGLISTHDAQTVEIPVELLRALTQAAGLAMSVEPAGGSPTGLPTGPVIYSGRCVEI